MRSHVERVLRYSAWLILAISVYYIHARRNYEAVDVIDSSGLSQALARWSRDTPPASVLLITSRIPNLPQRDWLAALGRLGMHVAWRATSTNVATATAIDVEPVADPLRPARIEFAARQGATLVLQDVWGTLDSARASRGIVEFRIPWQAGNLDIVTAGAIARGAVEDSLVLRKILLVAHAGWEAKFAARALEEEGWRVDVHFAVAPQNDVVSNTLMTLDTLNYSLVILLDSGVRAMAPQVIRYVEAGGGLIVSANSIDGLNRLVPAFPEIGRSDPSSPRDLPEQDPRRGLRLIPLSSLKRDAVVLERRGSNVAIAARREGLGRIIEIGYVDTWRWRMAGGDSGRFGHRTWWSKLVSEVAYAPAVERSEKEVTDPAPLAGMLQQFGAPQSALDRPPLQRNFFSQSVAFAIILAALFIEWASRRTRGLR